jgi:hypothetical protein
MAGGSGGTDDERGNPQSSTRRALAFPDVPRLVLDQLSARLVERA